MKIFISFVLLILLTTCTEKPKEKKFYNIFDPLADFDNIPPTVKVNVSPDSGIANETIFRFDASGSRENDYENVNLFYQWDMDNDSQWDSTATTEPVKNYKFSTGGGDKTINLRVLGAKNLYQDTSFTVFVNARPVIILRWTQEVNFFRFDVSDSYDLEDGKNLEYRWDFNSDGSWDVDWDTSTVAEYSYDNENWNLTVEARDGNNAVTTRNFIQSLNPIAAYSFSGDASDESGNGNDGIVHGATLTEDRFGNSNSAYYFDGVDNFIEISDNPVYKTKEKTISFWFYKSNDYIEDTPGPNDVEGLVFKAFSTNTPREYGFTIFNLSPPFGIQFHTVNNESAFNTQGPNNIQPYTWYNIVGTISQSEISLYINGQLVDKRTISGGVINTDDPIVLGKASSSSLNTRYFNGIIDDLYIYNRVLSSDEIENLYNP